MQFSTSLCLLHKGAAAVKVNLEQFFIFIVNYSYNASSHLTSHFYPNWALIIETIYKTTYTVLKKEKD